MNGSDLLLVLSLLAAAIAALRLLPQPEARPRKVPDYVMAGRRRQLERNRGRWERLP